MNQEVTPDQKPTEEMSLPQPNTPEDRIKHVEGCTTKIKHKVT